MTAQRNDRTIRLRRIAQDLADEWPEEEATQPQIHLNLTLPEKLGSASEKPSVGHHKDLPVAARTLLAILHVLPPWARLVLLLALIGLAIYSGSGLGWW